MSYVPGGGLTLENIAGDLDQDFLQMFNLTSGKFDTSATDKQNESSLYDASGPEYDWQSLPSGTQLGRDDGTSARETSSLDAGDYSTPGADMAAPQSLLSSLKNGASSVADFAKANPQLTQAALAGIAGAMKDKTAQETARQQIEYLERKQDQLNKSVTPYGKTYRKA